MSPNLAASLAMLDDISRRARAMKIGLVAYPVDDVERVASVLIAGNRAAIFAQSTLEPEPVTDGALLARAMDLLVVILDEPLATLPGGHPGGPDGPTELRLRHFQPEWSEKIAVLLEEAGR